MKNNLMMLYVATLLILLVACSDSNEKIECINGHISIVNKCDQDISISYYKPEVEQVILDLININECYVSEQSTTLKPEEETTLYVFLESCTDIEDEWDDCDMNYGEGTIDIQYGTEEKTYIVYDLTSLEVYPDDFE